MSPERNPFTHRVAMQLAAVEAELAHPDVSPYRAAELLRHRRRFLLSLESPAPIVVRREPETVAILTIGPRPSHWRLRSAGSIAARVATVLGILALATFLWLVAIDWALWGFGL